MMKNCKQFSMKMSKFKDYYLKIFNLESFWQNLHFQLNSSKSFKLLNCLDRRVNSNTSLWVCCSLADREYKRDDPLEWINASQSPSQTVSAYLFRIQLAFPPLVAFSFSLQLRSVRMENVLRSMPYLKKFVPSLYLLRLPPLPSSIPPLSLQELPNLPLNPFII